MKTPFLHRFASCLAGGILLLLFAGGLVTSTDSGLSVPDWPLSYGQFFPPMIGGIRFEHTHRVIAGTIGLITLGFMIAALILEKRKWVKRLAVLSFLMVVAQAILGGLTVIYLLPTPVSVAHACLGQTFFSLICLLVYFTSASWLSAPIYRGADGRALKKLLLLTTALAYTQLILGAIVRHAEGTAIPFHMGVAGMLLLQFIWIFSAAAKSEGLRAVFLRPAVFLAGLGVFQVFLGFGSFIYKIILEPGPVPLTAEVLITTAHQTTGAMILALLFVMSAISLRVTRIAESGR